MVGKFEVPWSSSIASRWDHPGLDALSNALTAERNARIEVWCHDAWTCGDPGWVFDQEVSYDSYDISIDFDRFFCKYGLLQKDWSGFQDTWILFAKISSIPWIIISHTCDLLKCSDLIPSRDPGKGHHGSSIPWVEHPQQAFLWIEEQVREAHAPGQDHSFKPRNPRSKMIKHRISMNIIQHHSGDVPISVYISMYFDVLCDYKRFKGNICTTKCMALRPL